MANSSPEKYYAVLLHGSRVATLCQRGDHTRFWFAESYLRNPGRHVLGLRFEQSLTGRYSSTLRLPAWFSNLLPEGPLREWIAQGRDVSIEREMELLAEVGHDLPGAVQVLPVESADEEAWKDDWISGVPKEEKGESEGSSPWRFSLAGVALKFSMLAQGDRLTVPAVNERGDWLVKFPDPRFPHVPRNEYAMMSLAALVGVDVPQIRLVHRDELTGVPARMWPTEEVWAYAVRRFDRAEDANRTPIHIEDLAQVKDVYPQAKYQGNFETVGALIYRGHDLLALREFGRRLAFSIVIGNGDAHAKNWSLIYRDRRIPTLSPAYDLVATAPYTDFFSERPEDLGLKLNGSRRFEAVRIASFARLEERIDAALGWSEAGLADIARETVRRVSEAWGARDDLLADAPGLRKSVTAFIAERAKILS
ncbi:type II toxin-antitoxin system HipA family toxin [Kitasatospora sp. NPDC127121]|uniref:type II toxin-antitoxin system HipA family toxin n=1 Tax=Kitasatospora sp. NPDC127121 TaxID=3345371 RepID=UPI00362D1776